MTTAIWFVCLEILFGRMIDVTLGTIRSVLTIKEKPYYAALIGVFEATIWFIVVRQALSVGAGGILVCLSYATGFAIGTLVGGQLSKLLIKGNVMLQIVTDSEEMISAIREAGFGASVVNVNSSAYSDEKFMLFCDIDKSRLEELKKLAHEFDDRVFIMVQETKHVFNGFIK